MAAQAYIARADVIAFYRARIFSALNVAADFDFDAEDDDPATLLLDAAIEAANETINAHLMDRYTLPIATVPRSLVEIGATLAFGTVLRTRPDVGVDADLESVKSAMATLKSLAEGRTWIEAPRRNAAERVNQGIVTGTMGGTTPLSTLLGDF